MISGEGIAQLSLPPPDSCVITAQVEGTTLTQAQYTRIASLMSSLLRLPTRALAYVGHTLHPLTLYWHCSVAQMGKRNVNYLMDILSAVVQEGIVQVNLGKKLDVMPQKNVSKTSDKERLRTYFIHVYMYIQCMAICTYICSEVLQIMSYTYTLSYSRPCMQCYILYCTSASTIKLICSQLYTGRLCSNGTVLSVQVCVGMRVLCDWDVVSLLMQ